MLSKDSTKGLLLVAIFSAFATYVTSFPFFKELTISPLVIGILLGIVYANTFRKKTPESWYPGIKFSTKKLLKLGIILYGFKLTFQDVSDIGTAGILLSLFMVVSTFFIGYFFGTKVLKFDKETSILISAGSSICGAAAVLATESILNSKPYKSIIAVTTVIIFSTLSMFLFPIVHRMGILGISDTEFGMFIGASFHGVSQVIGAGSAINAEVETTSIIIKMMRVMLISPFLIILSIWVSKLARKNSPNEKTNIAIPWFALIFIAVIAFNSLHLLPENIVHFIVKFDKFLLTMAMTALGMETTFDKFKGAGLKPIYLSFTLYVWLLVGGFFATKYFYLLF